MDSRNIRTVPMRDFKPPNINFGTVGLIVLLVLLAALVWSSIFTVAPEEVGVVLTFGKYSREAGRRADNDDGLDLGRTDVFSSSEDATGTDRKIS